MSHVSQLCQTLLFYMFASLVSQLRPFLLEGSQRFGKTTYVWVSIC